MLEKSPSSRKLSYNEKRELETLLQDIETLEERKNKINLLFNDTMLPYYEIKALSEELGKIVKDIAEKEARWFELSERGG